MIFAKIDWMCSVGPSGLGHLGLQAWFCFLVVPLPLGGAVIYQDFPRPLGINTLGRDRGIGPAYLIDGTIYRFHWLASPHDFDFDGNGSVDLTIGGSGRTEDTEYMFVSQQGRNQVWSISGGASGRDLGSFALALLGGTSIGPSLHGSRPAIGWHNDDDTGASSILMQAYNGSPINGDFLPRTLFERKYLGLRFEREGALHYGWMALSGFAFWGEEIYVYSWAYESEPNTSLLVGVVPEPDVLGLLGAGLVWWAARRRR